MNGGEHAMTIIAMVLLAALVGITLLYYWQVKTQREADQALVHKLVELLYSRTYSEWAQGQRTVARGMAEMNGMKVREPAERSQDYGDAAAGNGDL